MLYAILIFELDFKSKKECETSMDLCRIMKIVSILDKKRKKCYTGRNNWNLSIDWFFRKQQKGGGQDANKYWKIRIQAALCLFLYVVENDMEKSYFKETLLQVVIGLLWNSFYYYKL